MEKIIGERIKAALYGHPIYIATRSYQRRKHHKRRINKKWLKRYGCYELNLMPHGEMVMMDDGAIWMTKKTFEQFKKQIVTEIENDKRRKDTEHFRC